MTALTPRELAVVVVTHESAESLSKLLACLDAGARALVIAVDNGSQDGTASVARAAGVRVLANERNLGYAVACNQAAAAAESEVLCFLNPDCEPAPALFDHGYASVHADPTVCAAPLLIENDGREVAGRQPGYTHLKIAFDILETNCGGSLWHWMTKLHSFHDPSWNWAHGACWFVSRERFIGTGGMNTKFFLYMEDVDFGRRWCAAGGRIAQLDYRLHHQQGHGSRIPQRRRRTLLNRARLQYAAFHHGRWLACLLACATLPDRAIRYVMRQPS